MKFWQLVADNHLHVLTKFQHQIHPFHFPKGGNIVWFIGWKMCGNILAFLEEKHFYLSQGRRNELEEHNWTSKMEYEEVVQG